MFKMVKSFFQFNQSDSLHQIGQIRRIVLINNRNKFSSSLLFSVRLIVRLSLAAPPKWIIEPTDRNGVVGDAIQMHCMANGKPLPTVICKLQLTL